MMPIRTSYSTANTIKPGQLSRIDRFRLTGWAFAAPGMATLAIVLGFPVVYAIMLAFSSYTLLAPHMAPFTGLENIVSVLSDEAFWSAAWLTIRYSVLTVSGEFIIGLGIALMLNRVVKMRPVYFALLTIPMAMSPVSVALIWRMLLQPNLGIVNHMLQSAGLPALDWLGNPTLAFWTMAGIDIWQQVSFVVLILAAGLAALPKDPYEAAEIDGARRWQQFWYITLPMLRPVSAIAVVIQLINELRTYDLPYILTRGGPGSATEVLSFFAYRRAFLGLTINEGAAAALMLLLIVLIMSVIFFAMLERRRQ
ncbi:sugar ABC transporter permease [Pectobacteriaceae bacterium CE90]|nr:sugar ABC transporter permease [Prodigiosinella sp. LS101]WJV51907.1 sugar ABC transporter permease [Prodigiosinella sp. LS101]WJV56264.1 sugar ABC transporter permease [Pectobacteriaceae bacterium C111]WJY16939.1 sugar ABC transporter permease [Pectobacteriaceae bacterium CE90]